MPNFNKIDPEFLTQVKVQSANKTICLVMLNNLNDYVYLTNCQILYKFPFINAVGIKTAHQNILNLSSHSYIKYISSVKKASVYIDKAKKQIENNVIKPLNLTGKGTTVAVIDTGCSMHLDLVLGKNRIIKFVDFINNKKTAYDDNGHGTFVCGVLGGNGVCSNTKYCGIAPSCNIIALKALNSEGETQVFTILNAMQWVIDNKQKYNIDIVCMSFGSQPLTQNDPLVVGADVLWDNGIVVVCAAGNDGANNTVKSPAVSSKVISVGSCFYNNNQIKIAEFSSSGNYEGVIKPEILAPGVNITGLGVLKNYVTMSGTSVSAPMVAGAVSLMLQKDKNLAPNQVKHILKTACVQKAVDAQGYNIGVLNLANAISLIS